VTLLCAEVYFPFLRAGAPQPSQDALDLRILQAEWAHEVAVITYVYDETLRAQCTRGTAVRIDYGLNPNRGTYYGTVHHVAVEQQPASAGTTRLMQVVCIGPTDVLNAPGSGQYRDTRIDALVGDLAGRAGLSSLLEMHPYAWPLLQQLNQSAWAFLVSSARRAGWTLYPSATDVRCHSRAIRFSGALTFTDFGPASADLARAAVLTFSVVHGETLADGAKKRTRVLQGVDTAGVLFTTATGQQAALSGPRAISAKLPEYRKLAARSVSEADALLVGEQELNRHYISANATVSGDVRVHAGRAVRLRGIGQDYSGYWFVEKAEHHVTQALYQVGLTLGRDSLGDHSVAPSVVTETPRVVVNNGLQVAPNPASLRQTAPDTYWSTITASWRAQAPASRYLDPPLRTPPVPAAVSYA
jgi:hypothetical protein